MGIGDLKIFVFVWYPYFLFCANWYHQNFTIDEDLQLIETQSNPIFFFLLTPKKKRHVFSSFCFFFSPENGKKFVYSFRHRRLTRRNGRQMMFSFNSYSLMSSAILLASMDAPSNPRFVNPTAYSPHSPFQPFGNGLLGKPSFSENISLS